MAESKNGRCWSSFLWKERNTAKLYETAQMDVSVDASWNHLFCDFQICTNGGVGYIFPKLQPLFGNLGK